MLVRPKKQASRKGSVAPQRPAATHVFPAPTKGWVLSENIAMIEPGSARVLDNWVCTTTGIRARGGAAKYATLSASGGVTALFNYRSGGTEKFFGATDDSIFDISTVVDADVVPSAVVSGQTSGEYSTTHFGTVSGTYLYVLNGQDDLQLFDGTSWQAINGVSSPAITGVNTSDLTMPWVYSNRMFFIQGGSLSAWYLPVNNIAGAATELSLAGVFKQGGELLFGATWSIDAGDGLDDKCVFVSSEGEVAVYQGADPGSSTDWAKVGVYHISRPLGKNAFTRAGGDLLIATETGLVPLTQAISKDVAALPKFAVTRQIEPYWRSRVYEKTTKDWEILKWDESNILIVSQPDVGPAEGSCLVVNLMTQGWSRFTGWDTQCLASYAAVGRFGTSGGEIWTMESGGSDNGAVYTCRYLGQHEGLAAKGMEKTALQMRATFSAGSPFSEKVTAQTDYAETFASAPSSPDDYTSDVWDVGLWDTAIWDAGVTSESVSRWHSVGRSGFTIAPEVQLTFGVTPTPVIELVSIEMTYSVGDLVT